MYKIETLIFNPIFNHYDPVVGMPEWIDLETLSALKMSELEGKNVFGLIRIRQGNQIILDTFTDKIIGLWLAVAQLLLACLEKETSTQYFEEHFKTVKFEIMNSNHLCIIIQGKFDEERQSAIFSRKELVFALLEGLQFFLEKSSNSLNISDVLWTNFQEIFLKIKEVNKSSLL